MGTVLVPLLSQGKYSSVLAVIQAPLHARVCGTYGSFAMPRTGVQFLLLFFVEWTVVAECPFPINWRAWAQGYLTQSGCLWLFLKWVWLQWVYVMLITKRGVLVQKLSGWTRSMANLPGSCFTQKTTTTSKFMYLLFQGGIRISEKFSSEFFWVLLSFGSNLSFSYLERIGYIR